tara:strand:+ start:1208 stop:1396 length:189 start_codon:yes stop_codon:yes gene_type:complete
MIRDLSTPLAPTFAESTMGGPGKRKKRRKKSKGCFNARNCKVGGNWVSPKKRARQAKKARRR